MKKERKEQPTVRFYLLIPRKASYFFALLGKILFAVRHSRYAEPGSALQRILSEAPYLARCSDNKTAAHVRPREYAIRHPYLQVNRPGMTSWLIFDLDHENSFIWQDAGLPAPNLIVRNRANGHSHLFYAITPVCTSVNGRPKPIAFMKAVYLAFAKKLGADPEYHSGPVAKTPGHPWWETTEIHNGVFELGALADYVDLEFYAPWTKPNQSEAHQGSRHCALFDELRFYAYRTVAEEKKQGNLATFSARLERFAEKTNNFAARGYRSNLPHSSIKATVKSVARWVWDRYVGSGGVHRGAMGLDAATPLKERQGLAAKRTHDVRKEATKTKIATACARLRAAKTKITLTAVAKAANLARQTVSRYAALLADFGTPLGTPPKGEAKSPTDVSFAVHQVTAVLGEGRFPWRRSLEPPNTS